MKALLIIALAFLFLRVEAAPFAASDPSTQSVFDYTYDTNYLFPLLTGAVWRNVLLVGHPNYPDPQGRFTNYFVKAVVPGGTLRSDVNNYCLEVTFPNLVSGGTIQVDQSYATNFWFPALTNVVGDIFCFDCWNSASVNFTNLVNVTGVMLMNAQFGGFNNWDFSHLQTVGGYFQLGEMHVVTNVYTPVLKSVGGFIDISAQGGTGQITTGIGFPSLTKLGWSNFPATNFNLNGQSLTAAKVNELMAMLVALKDMAGNPWAGKADFSGGSNASPTGQGITDRSTLTNRGATILIN